MEADSFVFLGFNLHTWITIVTVLAMFTVLLFTKLRTAYIPLDSSLINKRIGRTDLRKTTIWCWQPKSLLSTCCTR